MIHRNDERAFRILEIVTYLSAVGAAAAVKRRGVPSEYGTAVLFVALSIMGIVYMSRFWIYAHPERIWDRTRADVINIPTRKKLGLTIGFCMCIPMLLLGCIGLYRPALMNRIISAVSPFDLTAL